MGKTSNSQHLLSAYYMPGTVSGAYLCNLYKLHKPCEIGILLHTLQIEGIGLRKGKTVAQGHPFRSQGSQDSNPGSVGQSHVPEGLMVHPGGTDMTQEREGGAVTCAKHGFLFWCSEKASGHQRPRGILSVLGGGHPLPQVRGEGSWDAFEEEQMSCAWNRWCRGLGVLGGDSESQPVFGSFGKALKSTKSRL